MSNIAEIKRFIRQQSSQKRIAANIILRHVIFDLFLEKLAQSEYRSQFIIKGGFLVSSLTNIESRTTMDLDVTIKNIELSKEKVAGYLNHIISIPTRNNLEMAVLGVDTIHEAADYPGLRVTLVIHYETLKETIKIDLTTGDPTTPSEVKFTYQTLVDRCNLSLTAYNLETLLAEKLETIFTRGILNTRSRDFYDVYLLWKLRFSEIRMDILRQAIVKTSKYRSSYLIMSSNLTMILLSLSNDAGIKERWETYQSKYQYAKDIGWESVIEVLDEILKLLGNLTPN